MADDNSTDDGDTATGAGTGTDTPPEGGQQDGLGDAGQRALAEERRLRKVAERDLAALRKASMTDQEKAVTEARAAGLAEAQKAAGPRLVRAEFRAAAANRVDAETLNAYLEDVDLTKFLGVDGEPDVKAIEARIKRLGGGTGGTNFDGGARGGTAKPQDMSSLIRMHAGVS